MRTCIGMCWQCKELKWGKRRVDMDANVDVGGRQRYGGIMEYWVSLGCGLTSPNVLCEVGGSGVDWHVLLV